MVVMTSAPTAALMDCCSDTCYDHKRHEY